MEKHSETHGLPCNSNSKEPACNAGDQGSIPGLGSSSGEGNGNPLQYSCLDNSIEKPGGLQSLGLQRVRHDWAPSLSLFTFMHWRRKWQPTPVFLPGECQGRWAAVYGVTQSRTWLKWLSSSSSSSFPFTPSVLIITHCKRWALGEKSFPTCKILQAATTSR